MQDASSLLDLSCLHLFSTKPAGLRQIYKYDEGASSDIVTVYGSFGGLLMALTGNYRHLSNVTIGNNVYLLVR